jgi:enoyl-CoA hydratase/carnithine racemase
MTPNGAVRVAADGGVAHVTIDHGAMNLLDAALLEDLDVVSSELAVDGSVRTVVIESANPEFFIAHSDVRGLIGRGTPHAPRRERLSRFAEMTERFRTMPKVTIAVIDGVVRGGGCEFILGLDLRFAARESAVFGFPEVALGIFPGGGGTQRLPALVGRARALELVATADDFDAVTAERYGLINRALPRSELRPFVERLARRIASFAGSGVAYAKTAMAVAEHGIRDGLLEEHRLFREILDTPEATQTLQDFLAAGGQTPEYELDLGDHLPPPRQSASRDHRGPDQQQRETS